MTPSPSAEPPQGVIPAARVDVLHVEDDDSYADLVQRWIAPHGLTFHRVRTRTELLDFLLTCARPPRCLLLDLGLKDSAGLRLCDDIKQAPAFQLLPIVLYSGADITPCESLEHGALRLVRKGSDGPQELLAALTAVISQHARSQGVVDLGDLRLDPAELEISVAGHPIAKLTPGRFAALLLLVKTAPAVVTDAALYGAFLQRHPYHRKDDLEPAIVAIVKNYVSHLRADLGAVGARIERVRGEGYAYRA